MADPALKSLYQSLLAQYGQQHWWPAQTRTEMIIGAILTQNTAWINVEKAISTLRNHGALDFKILVQTPATQLAEWIRPAGYYNQKTKTLKAFTALLKEFDGSLDRLFRLNTSDLRKKLIATHGIGPETADCILLYAAQRPVFVVDAYTRRLLKHSGLLDETSASYDQIATLFTDALPADARLYNEFHALIVCWGKYHPKKKMNPDELHRH